MSKTIEMNKMAESISNMVIEWVNDGIEMDTNWREGLKGIIQLRLDRLAVPPIDQKEATEPPSLVLPDRKEESQDSQNSMRAYQHGVATGWNACLDKVKELNQ